MTFSDKKAATAPPLTLEDLQAKALAFELEVLALIASFEQTTGATIGAIALRRVPDLEANPLDPAMVLAAVRADVRVDRRP